MAAQPSQKMNRGRAWSCALINQCATPGLGSLMGRRFISGTGQLLLALAGFGLLLVWMGEYFYRRLLMTMDEPVPQHPYLWLGKWGLICFGAGWAWSLITSISLLRQSRADNPAGEGGVPPRIMG